MNLRGRLSWIEPASYKERGAAATPRATFKMSARDEATMLLHAAAEVEHALLVQYLYAAYSLKVESDDPAQQQKLDDWYKGVLLIARQEMGHLATVQNLLWAIGGPLNFEREDFPFRSEFYPFYFRLEPLTRDSLAKYIVAEMPPLETLDRPTRRVVRYARRRAVAANRQTRINRVGALYARIIELFGDLEPDDFRFDTATRWQALPEDFGFVGPLHPDAAKKPFIGLIASVEDATTALSLVAEQGEGATDPSFDSHFELFLRIFVDADFPETNPLYGPASWTAIRAVPTDPLLNCRGVRGLRRRSCITAPLSRLVAELADVRYRVALVLLVIYFHADALSCPGLRKDTATWIAAEMRTALGGLGSLLPDLSRQAPDIFVGGRRAMAAAPWTLPYSLQFPERTSDKWRLLQALMQTTAEICRRIRLDPDVDANVLRAVTNVETLDSEREATVATMSQNDSC